MTKHILIFTEKFEDTVLSREDLDMCILFLYFCDDPSPDGYRLIMASNRDEFYFRPTAHAKFWEENPSIIAGKTFFCISIWACMVSSVIVKVALSHIILGWLSSFL